VIGSVRNRAPDVHRQGGGPPGDERAVSGYRFVGPAEEAERSAIESDRRLFARLRNRGAVVRPFEGHSRDHPEDYAPPL
jgi:hypothetical protein